MPVQPTNKKGLVQTQQCVRTHTYARQHAARKDTTARSTGSTAGAVLYVTLPTQWHLRLFLYTIYVKSTALQPQRAPFNLIYCSANIASTGTGTWGAAVYLRRIEALRWTDFYQSVSSSKIGNLFLGGPAYLAN